MKTKLLLLFLFCAAAAFGQKNDSEIDKERGPFSHADSLRGTLSSARSCFDVTHYNLQLTFDLPNKSLSGFNEISFKVVKETQEIQLDLFAQFQIDSVVFEHKNLKIRRDGAAFFVIFPQKLATYSAQKIRVYYNGKPNEAVKPPWDGGFVWRADRNGKPWVGVACEGHGASSWWPLKDHLSDEPDSMQMVFTVPKDLFCVANGTLVSITDEPNGEQKTFEWRVHYPINSYNVTVNIADYVHLKDRYQGEYEPLDLDYYVLRQNESKAKGFMSEQVKPMLACFEKYFGQYPFPKDGYALVETSYWGMEHQGAIAYGNNYRKNEWGFDYIIIHETGHEWYGNNISCPDHAELWIHESFTTYSEALFMECRHGYEKSVDYLLAQKYNILNEDAILGPKGVNFDQWKGSDMYYKGSWMLHTLRSVVNHDKIWFAMLLKMNQAFRHKIVSSNELIAFMNRELGKDYSAFFKQYLEYKDLPVLEYKIQKKKDDYIISYRWAAATQPLDIPIEIVYETENGTRKSLKITPTHKFQTVAVTTKLDNGKEKYDHGAVINVVPDERKYYILSKKL